MTKVFPIILIILDFSAGIVYGFNQDWRHMVYWWAAATLTACVTF